MNQFFSILSQIKERLNKEQNKVDDIVTIINESAKVVVTVGMLKIIKNTVVLQVPPTVKMVIFSKKDFILLKFQENKIPIYSIR